MFKVGVLRSNLQNEVHVVRMDVAQIREESEASIENPPEWHREGYIHQ